MGIPKTPTYAHWALLIVLNEAIAGIILQDGRQGNQRRQRSQRGQRGASPSLPKGVSSPSSLVLRPSGGLDSPPTAGCPLPSLNLDDRTRGLVSFAATCL